MNTAPKNDYPLPKDSYVAFDAISLRNLILKRLDEQGVFTDHNYIGSNLASIIDIISYSFNTLMFYLHKTSTESTFTEAQLFSSINKIVKLLDYKPIGYQTSTVTFRASADGVPVGFHTIPRYSYLMVGGTPYSFDEDISFSVTTLETSELSDLSNKKLLYQGSYKEYDRYLAVGDKNEVLMINETELVDHFHLDVYCYEQSASKWVHYKEVPSLYNEKAHSRTFEKRLNPDGMYEITFGDGANGRKLEEGDVVQVYYLVGTGAAGVIGARALNNSSPAVYTTPTFEEILASINDQGLSYIADDLLSSVKFDNSVTSTEPKLPETVEEIKKNSSLTFKSQSRLVTKEDVQNFVATNFANIITDVKVFDNWQYTKEYLKYFNDLQVGATGFGQILLNQVLFSDSCNFNNIYVCAVPKTSRGSSLKYLLPAQKEAVFAALNPIKIATAEITFMDPVYRAFSFGVYNTDAESQSPELNVLELVRRPNSLRTSNAIIKEAEQKFIDVFDVTKNQLGRSFDYSAIANALLSIDGVSKFRTRRVDTNQVFEGLSFLAWNPTYPDLNKKLIASSFELLPFEFPYFENLASITEKITVTEK